MQTRSQHFELEDINLEIERSCRKNRKVKKEKDKAMADQEAQDNPARALEEYGIPCLTGSQNVL